MFNQNHIIMNYKQLLRGIFAAALLLQFFSVSAQNADQKWSLGLHGAIIEPKTSLGDQFFKFTINSTTFGQGLSLVLFPFEHYQWPKMTLPRLGA